MSAASTRHDPVARRRFWAASLVAAAAAVAAVVPGAEARISILAGDGAAISRIAGPQPYGEAGLSRADGLYELGAGEVLGPDRQVARVSAESLASRKSKGVASLLRERVAGAGAHLVVVDDLGWDLGGPAGERLADALAELAAESAPYAPDGLARRIHLNLPSRPLPLIHPDSFAGAWRAMTLAGGVWLEADRGSKPWATEEWLAWPGEVARELEGRGGDAGRVHLLLSGAGDHAAAWRMARSGDACRLLANGPGAERLGGDAAEFVAQFRLTFGLAPAPAGPSAIACWPGAELDEAQAAALAAVLEGARSGLVVPDGAIEPASLTRNRPAEVLVRLGPDPLGVAAAFRVDPEGFWGRARAEVLATGPGFSERARIRADGSALLAFTPPSPGPVRMRLVVPGTSIQRALGRPVDLVGALKPHEESLDGTWYRILGAPAEWALGSPLVRPGQPPGSPVLEVEDLPEPPPDPGGEPTPEPAPVPAPIPGPEPQPAA